MSGRKRRDWPERLAAKYADRVTGFDDERGSGEGVWFSLQPGWVTDEPTHQVHEDTEYDAETHLQMVTKTCDCDECVTALRAASAGGAR